MKRVKVMLAGIGGYGDIYFRRLMQLSDEEKIEVVGLVDPFPPEKHLPEIERRGWRLFKTTSEFYESESCDLVFIATPIQFHTKMILEALEHGCNVLCEKPMTGDIRDIEALKAARDASGKFVMIGYQWSYSNAILNMKRDIIAGKYGKPEYFKTIVLWPRNEAYFKRGTGWAGKITASDGTLILDSVANNAAAHYLHNIFFTLGSTIDSSLEPETVDANLFRANPIENFDTAIIRCKFENGARALYIASHSTDRSLEPCFEYRFENGVISFSEGLGGIIARLGTQEICYGDPFENAVEKIDLAVKNVFAAEKFIPCGIEAASAQVGCIAKCREFPIVDFDASRREIKDGGFTYIKNLYEDLTAEYTSN